MSRNHYLDADDLSRWVAEYQQTGAISDDLGRGLMALVDRVYDTFAAGYGATDPDDLKADCVLHLVTKKLSQVQPDDNVFSYLTQACRWFFQGRCRRDLTAAEHRQRYARAKAAAGKLPQAERDRDGDRGRGRWQ